MSEADWAGDRYEYGELYEIGFLLPAGEKYTGWIASTAAGDDVAKERSLTAVLNRLGGMGWKIEGAVLQAGTAPAGMNQQIRETNPLVPFNSASWWVSRMIRKLPPV